MNAENNAATATEEVKEKEVSMAEKMEKPWTYRCTYSDLKEEYTKVYGATAIIVSAGLAEFGKKFKEQTELEKARKESVKKNKKNEESTDKESVSLDEAADNDVDHSDISESVMDYIKSKPLFDRGKIINIAKHSYKLVKWTLNYISNPDNRKALSNLVTKEKEFVNAVAAKFNVDKIYKEDGCIDLDTVDIDSEKLVSSPSFLVSLKDILDRKSPEFLGKIANKVAVLAKEEAVATDESTEQQTTVNNMDAPITNWEVSNNVFNMNGEVVGKMNSDGTTSPLVAVPITPVTPAENPIVENYCVKPEDINDPQGDLTDEEFEDYENTFRTYLAPIGNYKYKKEDPNSSIVTVYVTQPNKVFRLLIDNGSNIYGFDIPSIRAFYKSQDGRIFDYFVPVTKDTSAIVCNIIKDEGLHTLTNEELEYVEQITNHANFILQKTDMSVTVGKELEDRATYRFIISKLGSIYNAVMENFKPGFEFFSRIEKFNSVDDFTVVVDERCPVPEGTPMLTGLSAMVQGAKITIMYQNTTIDIDWKGIPTSLAGEMKNNEQQQPDVQ